MPYLGALPLTIRPPAPHECVDAQLLFHLSYTALYSFSSVQLHRFMLNLLEHADTSLDRALKELTL